MGGAGVVDGGDEAGCTCALRRAIAGLTRTHAVNVRAHRASRRAKKALSELVVCENPLWHAPRGDAVDSPGAPPRTDPHVPAYPELDL